MSENKSQREAFDQASKDLREAKAMAKGAIRDFVQVCKEEFAKMRRKS